MTSRADRARKIQAVTEAEGSAIRDALVAPTRTPDESTPPPARPPKPAPTPAASTPAPTTKERTVRYTIDLNESQHRRLKLIALDNRVRAAEVFRAALDGHTDDELAKLIEARRQTP